jgi:aldose 1-epimerase
MKKHCNAIKLLAKAVKRFDLIWSPPAHQYRSMAMPESINLRLGDATAVVMPQAGGRAVSLTLCDNEDMAHDVLYPYSGKKAVTVPWDTGGIFPLVPYLNRIVNSTLQFNSKKYTLAAHPMVTPDTLHGNGHLQSWPVENVSVVSIDLLLDSPSSEHWPWRYKAFIRVELLSQSVMSLTLKLENSDLVPQPGGIGFHPYFLHRVGSARQHGAFPESLVSEVGQSWTQHLAHWDGHASVVLHDGSAIRLEADPIFGHLVLHQPNPSEYFCVEPVSHIVNGFNLAHDGILATGMRLLGSGQSMVGKLVIEQYASQEAVSDNALFSSHRSCFH